MFLSHLRGIHVSGRGFLIHPVFLHQGFFTNGRVSKRGTLKFTDGQGELIISSRSILDPHTQRAFMKKPTVMAWPSTLGIQEDWIHHGNMCNKFLVVDQKCPITNCQRKPWWKEQDTKNTTPYWQSNQKYRQTTQLLPRIYDCLRDRYLFYFHLENLTSSLTKFIFRFIPANQKRPPGQGHLGISSWRPLSFGWKPIFSHSKKGGRSKKLGKKKPPTVFFQVNLWNCKICIAVRVKEAGWVRFARKWDRRKAVDLGWWCKTKQIFTVERFSPFSHGCHFLFKAEVPNLWIHKWIDSWMAAFHFYSKKMEKNQCEGKERYQKRHEKTSRSFWSKWLFFWNYWILIRWWHGQPRSVKTMLFYNIET